MTRRVHRILLVLPVALATTLLSASGAPPPLAGAAALEDSLSSRLQNQADLDKRFVDAWAKQARVNVGVPAGTAKVVVVKFNDWMCPGCKFWKEALAPTFAKYQATPGGAFKYVEKDWPWNTDCNAGIKQGIDGHQASCAAAAAVRIAADRGKREAMADWLYANQPETPETRRTMPDRVKAKAAELLGVMDFPAAYALKLPLIRKDVSDGVAAQIRSTPTYFINGIRAVDPDGGTIPIHYFDVAIQYELRKAAGGK